jgi:uncharacterized damage-inducible protein DinB
VSSVAEREALLVALREQREHVVRAVTGLSDAALRQPVLPSGWTCLGLIQHLTLDVERFWFRAVVAGETVDLCSGDEAWRVPVVTHAVAVLDNYREEIRRADAVIASTDLEAEPAWWPTEVFPDLPVRDLRQIVLAVLGETACHAGHLDVVRELLDGHQDLVLT